LTGITGKTTMSRREYFERKAWFSRAPGPRHADLAGAMKFNRGTCAISLSAASARETAARVAAGGVCKKILAEFGVGVYSFVTEIGGIRASVKNLSLKKALLLRRVSSPYGRQAAEGKMMEVITDAGKKGDTVGGVFRITAPGCRPGLEAIPSGT